VPFRNPFAIGILGKRLHGLTDSTHTPMIRSIGNAPDVRNLTSFTVLLSCKTIPLFSIYYPRWPSNPPSTRNHSHVTSPPSGRVDRQGSTFRSNSTTNQAGLSTKSCVRSRVFSRAWIENVPNLRSVRGSGRAGCPILFASFAKTVGGRNLSLPLLCRLRRGCFAEGASL
jgi:hypothetical protein